MCVSVCVSVNTCVCKYGRVCVCVHTLVSLLDHVSRVMTVRSPGFSDGEAWSAPKLL